MFADCLLDSAWAHDSRRGWTTMLSFAVQALAVGVLLLLPLIYGEGLSALPQWTAHLVAPEPPPGPPAPTQARAQTAPTSNLASDGTVIQPASFPDYPATIAEQAAPPVDTGNYVAYGTSDRWSNNPVMHSILSAGATVLPPAVTPTVTRVPPVSRMMEGNLVHKAQPAYPLLAREARIQGPVVLQAVISREGTIENLQVVSGHPLLVPAAIEAVRQWRYRPYFLNGAPVEVETQVTVNFVLGGG